MHLKPCGELDLFAGSDKEEGIVDGPIKTCRFKQPMGICTEFDSVVYVCDAQANSLMVCTEVKQCSLFLNAMGSLYNAFSVHNKGSIYTVKRPDEALILVRQCKDFLNDITVDIRSNTGISRTLNGPEGHLPAKTVQSVSMTEWGLQRLFDNLKTFDYQATNWLSCMTLDVEDCHSTVHIKQANMSAKEYSRSFGVTMKESFKRMTQWGAYYHTNRESWYPKPEETISFSKVPTMKPLPVVDLSQADCEILRNWASSYGAAVRQRTVRQETTMAKHGTLPEFMYQRECVTLDNPVTITSAQHAAVKSPETVDDQTAEDDTADEELVDEFDPSSDEEIEETTDESAPLLQGTLQGGIGSAANFLLGARSRFGRVIRFNNRLLY